MCYCGIILPTLTDAGAGNKTDLETRAIKEATAAGAGTGKRSPHTTDAWEANAAFALTGWCVYGEAAYLKGGGTRKNEKCPVNADAVPLRRRLVRPVCLSLLLFNGFPGIWHFLPPWAHFFGRCQTIHSKGPQDRKQHSLISLGCLLVRRPIMHAAWLCKKAVRCGQPGDKPSLTNPSCSSLGLSCVMATLRPVAESQSGLSEDA